MPFKKEYAVIEVDGTKVLGKKCKVCEIIKPLTDFSISSMAGNYMNICKSCNVKRVTDWHKANPDRKSDYKLKARYNITGEEYAAMYIRQEGKCLVCNETHEKLVVDHCHATNVVRGLLCDRCNRGLGAFGDNMELLQKAMNYILRFTESIKS